MKRINNSAQHFNSIVEYVAFFYSDNSRILDIGCGSTSFGKFLYKNKPFYKYVGVDPVLDGPRGRQVKDFPYLSFESNIEDAIYCNGSYDLILFSKSLHHLDPDYLSEVIVRLYEILSPGGYILAVEPGYNCLFSNYLSFFHDESSAKKSVFDVLDCFSSRASSYVVNTDLYFPMIIQNISDLYNDYVIKLCPEESVAEYVKYTDDFVLEKGIDFPFKTQRHFYSLILGKSDYENSCPC